MVVKKSFGDKSHYDNMMIRARTLQRIAWIAFIMGNKSDPGDLT